MTKKMNLTNKLYQDFVVDKIIKSNLESYSSYPLVVELDPTTACNLACHGCISASLLNQGGFKRERIKELAKEFVEVGVKAVVLIGGGEPCLLYTSPSPRD